MLKFVLSRSGQTVAVLFMASVIIFAIMRLIPGDPVLGQYEMVKEFGG